jgi:hypothetical protein
MTSETKGEILIVGVFAALGLWLLTRGGAAEQSAGASPLPSPGGYPGFDGGSYDGAALPGLLGGNTYSYTPSPLNLSVAVPYAAGQAASCGCGGGTPFGVFGRSSAFLDYVAGLPGVTELQTATAGKWN